MSLLPSICFILFLPCRFPTYSHLVEAGVMTVSELRALERAQTMTDYPCYWIPITWASNIIEQAASQGYIKVTPCLP